MHTPCDVAVLEREQQSRAVANGAAARFTRAEVTFPQFDSHVGMYPYRNTPSVCTCLKVAEQDRYLRCDAPKAMKGRERAFACADVCARAVSREWGGGGGEDCSIPHRIDFPAQRGDVGNVSL